MAGAALATSQRRTPGAGALGVGTPRAVNALAIRLSVATPAARTSAITGRRSVARAVAFPDFAAAAMRAWSELPGSNQGLPSFAASLGRSQGGFRARADRDPLRFRRGRVNMQHEQRGGRHVGRDEGDAGLHQPGDEVDVAGQPVELGDQQGQQMTSADRQGVGQLGRGVLLALSVSTPPPGCARHKLQALKLAGRAKWATAPRYQPVISGRIARRSSIISALRPTGGPTLGSPAT